MLTYDGFYPSRLILILPLLATQKEGMDSVAVAHTLWVRQHGLFADRRTGRSHSRPLTLTELEAQAEHQHLT